MMKRLYNRLEKLRYLNIVIFLLQLLTVGVYLNIYDKVVRASVRNGIVTICMILGILELIVLLVWYPKEYKLKRAIKKGEEYVGRIRSIFPKARKFKSFYGDDIIYGIKVSYSISGKTYLAEFGDYTNFPLRYLKQNDKCKIYIYKKQVYAQFFYVEVQNYTEWESSKGQENLTQEKLLTDASAGKFDNTPLDKLFKYSLKDIETMDHNEYFAAMSEIYAERMYLSFVHSKSYLILAPCFFRYSDVSVGMAELFIEVHMTSRKKYNSIELSLGKKLSKYLRSAENDRKYYHTEEEYLLEDIRKLITKEINEKNKNITINEICIAVRHK